jgi:hypothetical protein
MNIQYTVYNNNKNTIKGTVAQFVNDEIEHTSKTTY